MGSSGDPFTSSFPLTHYRISLIDGSEITVIVDNEHDVSRSGVEGVTVYGPARTTVIPWHQVRFVTLFNGARIDES